MVERRILFESGREPSSVITCMSRDSHLLRLPKLRSNTFLLVLPGPYYRHRVIPLYSFVSSNVWFKAMCINTHDAQFLITAEQAR
jgi:hypothetical protein